MNLGTRIFLMNLIKIFLRSLDENIKIENNKMISS